MNPSQEPAQQPPLSPPTDPTADAGAYRGPTHQAQPGALTPHDEPATGFPGGGVFGLAHPSGPDSAGYDDPAAFRGPLGFRQAARRSWRRTAAVTAGCALAVSALGAPLGLLWQWVAPSVPVIDTGDGGVVVNDPSPEEYIAADGWFTLLGLAFGLLVAVLAWRVLRRDRGPFLLLGVVGGALGAGYLVAPWIGGMVGRADYRHWEETAAQGATYLAPAALHSTGPMLVPAFIAAIVLTLLAGWSNDPELDQPGAKPGYGPNAGSSSPYSYGHPGPTDRPGPAPADDPHAAPAPANPAD